MEQRGCVPPSTWGQVLDVPWHGDVQEQGAELRRAVSCSLRRSVHAHDVRRTGAREKVSCLQHGWCPACWTTRSLKENWQVPRCRLLNWAAGAMLRRGLTTREANTGTVRIWCPAENAPLCMRLQPNKSREVRTLISAGGWRRRGRGSAEGVGARSGKGPHSTRDGNP